MYASNKNIGYAVIPHVYEEFTKQNNDIIVMECLEGMKLQDISDEDKDEFSYLLAKFGAKCILYDRLYHAGFTSRQYLISKNR